MPTSFARNIASDSIAVPRLRGGVSCVAVVQAVVPGDVALHNTTTQLVAYVYLVVAALIYESSSYLFAVVCMVHTQAGARKSC